MKGGGNQCYALGWKKGGFYRKSCNRNLKISNVMETDQCI